METIQIPISSLGAGGRLMHFFFATRKWSISCLAIALVTGVWVPLCYAPQPDKPEKISIDTLVWNSQAQTFDVNHSASFGIATGAESAGFTLKTLLLIADELGNLIDVVGQEDFIAVQERGLSEPGDETSLEPQWIAWDSQGRAFIAIVTVLSEVLNPAGQSIASASLELMVEIR